MTAPTTAKAAWPKTMLLALAGALTALFVVIPATSASAQAPATANNPIATAETGRELQIERRGMLLLEWGNGMIDYQNITGGHLTMNANNVGSGEITVYSQMYGPQTHKITSARAWGGGLHLDIEVKSNDPFSSVVHFTTMGAPLMMGPSGGYEGDMEDWAGVNDLEVYGLTFKS